MAAPTRDGEVRLEVAPRHTLLAVAEHLSLSVTDRFATLVKAPRNKRRKKRALRLNDSTRLLVAPAVYSEEVGIWYQPRPGMVLRLFGLRPRELLDNEALDASRKLDHLVERLWNALRVHGHGVKRAVEVGRGADRVLVMDFGDRLLVHVRRLFRERPRLALEVHANGTIGFPGTALKPIRCTSRFGVTVMGNYVRFADPTGRDLGALSLPWVTPEDRSELVEIIADRIHHKE